MRLTEQQKTNLMQYGAALFNIIAWVVVVLGLVTLVGCAALPPAPDDAPEEIHTLAKLSGEFTWIPQPRDDDMRPIAIGDCDNHTAWLGLRARGLGLCTWHVIQPRHIYPVVQDHSGEWWKIDYGRASRTATPDFINCPEG